jgi:hypothetical protein
MDRKTVAFRDIGFRLMTMLYYHDMNECFFGLRS